MKTLILLGSFVLTLIAISARAGIQTLITTSTNMYSPVITVCSNSYVVVKSVDDDDGGLLLLNIQGNSFTKDFSFESVTGLTISGPATIQLEAHPNSYVPTYATIDVEPQLLPVPPNQTTAIGSDAGNVQVTMQTSTNLVNWASAVNGMVYTNTPDARFFRIQMQTSTPSQ
jgi:hypothetical protein